jgi:hypothetical protein
MRIIMRERKRKIKIVSILDRRFTEVVGPTPFGGRSGGSADNCWGNAHGFNQENGDRSIVIYYYNTQKVYEISAFVQVFSHVCLGS